MKKILFAKALFGIVFLFWIGETWWFGWNDKPINDAEKKCDQIVMIGYGICFFLYCSPIMKWLEKQVAKDEK